MKINLRTLLVIVFLITSLAVISQNISTQILLILTSLILLISYNPTRHKFKHLFHRLKNLIPIVLTLMIFQVLFRNEGEILWQYGFIKITSIGLDYGIVSSLRLLLIILIAGLLFDIPYYEYLLAFRGWKIPYEISFLVASVIHFIPIFTNKFQTSIEALLLREINLQKLPFLKRPGAYLSLIFPVVAKAIADVRYRAISLELRAFRLYKERTYFHNPKLNLIDYVIQIGVFLIFLLIIYFLKI